MKANTVTDFKDLEGHSSVHHSSMEGGGVDMRRPQRTPGKAVSHQDLQGPKKIGVGL